MVYGSVTYRAVIGLFFLCLLQNSLGAQTETLVHFPADSGNYWVYRIDTIMGTFGNDTMRVVNVQDISGEKYHLFDKYLPLSNLTFGDVDTILIRATTDQVFLRVDSTEYLWYDFDAPENDTVEIVIPEITTRQGDTLKVLTWKENWRSSVFAPEDPTIYDVSVFYFISNGLVGIDIFLPKLNLGLVAHSFGGVDPGEYNLIEANVNGQQFDRNLVSVETVPAPSGVRLLTNYPNPFNPTTMIEYELARSTHVRLLIYNSLGQLVTSLIDKWQTAGRHTVAWDGTGAEGETSMPSGVYIYELRVDSGVTRRKMLLMR